MSALSDFSTNVQHELFALSRFIENDRPVSRRNNVCCKNGICRYVFTSHKVFTHTLEDLNKRTVSSRADMQFLAMFVKHVRNDCRYTCVRSR
jgi:hypothetical protein